MNNIQDLLDKRGWTVYKLFKQTGLTYNTTSYLAKIDKIPDGTEYGSLKKIAGALGVGIDDLEDCESG